MTLSDLATITGPTILVSLAFAAATSLLTAACYPCQALRRRLLEAAPTASADVLFALASAPLFVALSVAVASFLPSVLAWLSLQSDHCTENVHAHLHLCLLHPPPVTMGMVASLVPPALASLILARIGRELWRGEHARRCLATLAATSTPDTTRGVHWIASRVPLAAAVGGARHGKVIVSSLLGERLVPRELAAVIAHERAHLQRRDATWRTIASALSIVHVPAVRRMLLADLALTCEEACDDEAVRAIGDRVSVATALVGVSRLWSEAQVAGAAAAAAAPAFTGADITTRVTRLLEDPSPARLWLPRAWTTLGSIGALATGAGREIHHLTEALTDRLL